MKKRFVLGLSWLWLAAFFYAVALFAWYMHYSMAPFHMMTSTRDPFSFIELMERTCEYFQFDWTDLGWMVIPSIIGYAVFARRHTWRAFFWPSLWLVLTCLYYFSGTFEGEIGYQFSLRGSPEWQTMLPWWFHVLAFFAHCLYPMFQLFLGLSILLFLPFHSLYQLFAQ